jgi:hypothetical protein
LGRQIQGGNDAVQGAHITTHTTHPRTTHGNNGHFHPLSRLRNLSYSTCSQDGGHGLNMRVRVRVRVAVAPHGSEGTAGGGGGRGRGVTTLPHPATPLACSPCPPPVLTFPCNPLPPMCIRAPGSLHPSRCGWPSRAPPLLQTALQERLDSNRQPQPPSKPPTETAPRRGPDAHADPAQYKHRCTIHACMTRGSDIREGGAHSHTGHQPGRFPPPVLRPHHWGRSYTRTETWMAGKSRPVFPNGPLGGTRSFERQ